MNKTRETFEKWCQDKKIKIKKTLPEFFPFHAANFQMFVSFSLPRQTKDKDKQINTEFPASSLVRAGIHKQTRLIMQRIIQLTTNE